ncbi:SRPBCC domain-containing protein [Methanolobus sp. ZRKC3]|uniref:SRPBCC family protein n=1 Tax=Methanolobus sp. ZRKC3 TaxID=3125786 RepID=UPI00324B016E
MRKICTDIIIDSPAENVWDILTDFEKYEKWNPFLHIKNGKAEAGSRPEVLIQPPGSRAMLFNPEITKVDNMRDFRWMGKLWIKGLFNGEHVFRIEILDENRTRFIQCERFRGILAPIIIHLIGTNVQKGFENMNISLKNKSEKEN